jgi:hypothetical protein
VLREVAEALRQHILRNAEVFLESAEAPHPEEGLAHDQERPPVAQHLERPRHRAVHLSKAIAHQNVVGWRDQIIQPGEALTAP